MLAEWTPPKWGILSGDNRRERTQILSRGRGQSTHLTHSPLLSILQQVKTVRFQNYSPPPTKHYASHPTSGKHEQPSTLKGSQSEAIPSGAEMTILFAHRSGCHSGQQTDLRRKSAFGKTMPPLSTTSGSQTIFTSQWFFGWLFLDTKEVNSM